MCLQYTEIKRAFELAREQRKNKDLKYYIEHFGLEPGIKLFYCIFLADFYAKEEAKNG